MLVSLKWLKELVDIGVPVPELADRLDMTGTAVEAVHQVGAALEGIVEGGRCGDGPSAIQRRQ